MSYELVMIIKVVSDRCINGLQRFFPSEFGMDPDQNHAVEPAARIYSVKASIRRAIEDEGIPYTFVSSFFFAGYFLSNLGQSNASVPPRDKVVILGDGNPKGMCLYVCVIDNQ